MENSETYYSIRLMIMDKKPAFYFLKNSKGEFDGLWSLAIYSFLFIVIVTLSQIIISTINWYYYISVLKNINKDVARIIKAPEMSLRDIASWVSAFGGLCLAPVIAGYVARRNEMLKPDEAIRIERFTAEEKKLLDKTPVVTDDKH